MSAGTTDHLMTNASPRMSSATNTTALIKMINAVITGKCLGRRDASDKGTTVPTYIFSAAHRVKAGPRAVRGLATLCSSILFTPAWQALRGCCRDWGEYRGSYHPLRAWGWLVDASSLLSPATPLVIRSPPRSFRLRGTSFWRERKPVSTVVDLADS